MIEARYHGFLLARGTGVAPHGKGTLLDHLVGTHDLLERWRASEPVRIAGLFHSIYGTTFFKHRSVPLTERHVLMKLIGSRAEALAFQFCTLERPRCLFGGAPWLPWTDIRDLAEIEAANLIQQGGAYYIKSLLDLPISEAAHAAIIEFQRGKAAA